MPTWWDLDNDTAYQNWRAAVLGTPQQDTPIGIADPRALTPSERDAVLRRIAASGVAIYHTVADPGAEGLLELGAQLGLTHTDHHPGAEASGVVRLEVRDDMARYIPYTTRRLRWHTDGYYRTDDRRIGAFVLHCVRQARNGGINMLLDPRRVYIALRDQNRDWIRALMHEEAFTIPQTPDRPAYTGPVFALWGEDLYMRFTERAHNIHWHDDCTAARAALDVLLNKLSATVLLLGPGDGLVTHNVLHAREDFADDPDHPRLLYRVRYTDRAHPPC